ncbi:MAG: hypothetical protein JWP89_2070 [Schlesneria sp.]|nr:hypothetical protein [Schlesneria sp.]
MMERSDIDYSTRNGSGPDAVQGVSSPRPILSFSGCDSRKNVLAQINLGRYPLRRFVLSSADHLPETHFWVPSNL